MFTSTQNDPIDGVFVQIKQASGGSNANPLSCVVDDLPNYLGVEM
jgi:hypothetical protein